MTGLVQPDRGTQPGEATPDDRHLDMAGFVGRGCDVRGHQILLRFLQVNAAVMPARWGGPIESASCDRAAPRPRRVPSTAVRRKNWLAPLDCASQHARLFGLGQLAEPGGLVDRVTDHGVLESLVGTDIAGHDGSGSYTDAGGALRHLVGEPPGDRAGGGQRIGLR